MSIGESITSAGTGISDTSKLSKFQVQFVAPLRKLLE
jgi:hypothetical protein